MRRLPIQGAMRAEVVAGLEASTFFESLQTKQLDQVADRAELIQFDPGESLMAAEADAEDFFLLLAGSVKVIAKEGGTLCELGPYETVGEMALLLSQPRSATVRANEETLALRFEAAVFEKMVERIPHFAIAVARALARRLAKSSRSAPLPEHETTLEALTSEVLTMLPIGFVQRHHVLPVARSGTEATIGFVDDPTPELMERIRRHLPSFDLRSVRITRKLLDEVLRSTGGVDDDEETPVPTVVAPAADKPEAASAPQLDKLLRRMVAEGASDVHLSAAHKPRWRIDGDVYEIEDSHVLGEDEVWNLLEPVMSKRSKAEFSSDNDADFAYAIEGVSRFRVNLFRDAEGVGAVFRQIPERILSLEDLGLPDVVTKLSNIPKGLVLVTGPTGSGKSTTLAAMVDYINRSRRAHIITLEDPIEFRHPSRLSLVNQREVGSHTKSFSRALRASLREDPDIVLVGEMRDLETIALALETAQTGHLVFGTLHTSTAMSSVDRIIDMFPADQQPQIRTSLSETLRGVIAQTLCKRIGGGRVAALEILVATPAVANLVREGKTYQLVSIMQTGSKLGMTMLNEELAKLVFEEKVEATEALAKAVDKQDLMKRLGVDYPLL